MFTARNFYARLNNIIMRNSVPSLYIVEQFFFQSVNLLILGVFHYFPSENTTEGDNSEQEGEPPFTLHIGMLFTAVCRLVTF